MPKPSPPPERNSPPQPSRRWRLRGIFFWLVLLTLLLVPLVGRFPGQLGMLGESLRKTVFSLTTGSAQRVEPTLTSTLPIIPTASAAIATTMVPTSETPAPATTTAVVSSPSPPVTSPVPREGWLIFSLLDRERYHLFAYQPGQQVWLRLSEGDWDDLYPAVSPDGRWIAFTSNRERYWDIYLLSVEDGRVVPLTRTRQYDGSPTWSPDGKWLAYESYLIDPQTQQGNLEILIQAVNADPNQSQQIIQLTSGGGADFAPRWSPRGRQIAFISQRAGENDLWIADLDRIDDRYQNLSGFTSASVRALSWSADGRWLVWSASDDGVAWIYRWDADSPASPSRKVIPGNDAILSADGNVLYSIFATPQQAYLQEFSLETWSYPMPLIHLPAQPKGMSWLAKEFPTEWSRDSYLSDIRELFPRWEGEQGEAGQPSATPLRRRLQKVEGLQAPFPYLHEDVLAPFQALRQAVVEQAGWDYLSQLENAYLPLTSPSFPAFYEDWLYTGRAIALETAAMDAGWLMTVREQFGDEIYWHLYLKTLYQDGSQGMPLRELPFDLNARYSGDPVAYDRGGAWLAAAPSGYWIDLTELAQRYGWERLPAFSTWRTALSTARYSILVHRSQLDWYSAMLELYPAQALYTATPLPSPTLTATRTAIPTRTPTPTPTSRPTLTPSPWITPTQAPGGSPTP